MGAIAFNPSNDPAGRSVALKASDWGCFPRISPLLNQVELWQFSPGFSLIGRMKRRMRIDFFYRQLLFTKLHRLLRCRVANQRFRAHSEFKRSVPRAARASQVISGLAVF